MGEAHIWSGTSQSLPRPLLALSLRYSSKAPSEPYYHLLDNMTTGKNTVAIDGDADSTEPTAGADYCPNPALDGQITRKIDIRLVPVLLVMFMLAYLDRSNLGNAKIQGLEHDLHMKGRDYNVASLIFYVSYIVFEVPSNLILAKVAPSTWLSVLLFFWGMLASDFSFGRSDLAQEAFS